MTNESNRFFKFVWRFNAIVIAGAALFCCVLVIISAVALVKGGARNQHAANIVNAKEQARANHEFTFGAPDVLTGTNFVKIPLNSGQPHGLSYDSSDDYGSRSAVNYLFLNSATGQSAWLVPTTNQLFVYELVVSNKLKKSDKETNKVTGLIYAVAEKDSNGDERINEKDAVAIVSSSVDGTDYKKLVDPVDRLYSLKQIADDKILVLYEKGNETKSEIYEVPALKKLSETTLPKLNVK